MSDYHDLDWLFEKSKRLPLLSEEQVIYHARIIQRHNRTDQPSRRLKELYQQSKKILIERNIRLVSAAVRRYAPMATPAHGLGDMAQDGLLGLAHGIDLFDPTRGYRISTFLWHWCRQGVSRGLHLHARTIRLPSHAECFLNAHRKYQEQLHRTNAITDFDDYLLMRGRKDMPANGTRKRLEEIAVVISPTSLDAQFNEDSEKNLGDFLCDQKSDGRNTLEAIARQEEYDQIKATMLTVLNESERRLIEDYYLRGASSLKLADEYGISSSVIRTKVRKAMDKLREALGVTPSPVAA